MSLSKFLLKSRGFKDAFGSKLDVGRGLGKSIGGASDLASLLKATGSGGGNPNALAAAAYAMKNPKTVGGAGALGAGILGGSGYAAMGGDKDIEDIEDMEDAGEYGSQKIKKLLQAIGL